MKRLLIVDDNPADRALLSDLLAEEGRSAPEILEAGSLGAAREVIAGTELDLVALDVRLPDGYGPSLVPELRGRERSPAVVVLSGSADTRDAVEAVRAGAYDYLAKDDLSPGLVGRTLRAAVQQNEARHRALQQLRSFAGSLPEPAWASEREDPPTIVNDAWSARFGSGRSWIELVAPEARAAAEAAWERACAEREPLELRTTLVDRAGQRRSYLVRARPGLGETWYGSLTDVDELERARAQLERLAHRKDDFMAALAHELRNPLSSLSLVRDMLTESPDEVGRVLPIFQRQLAQLERMVDDLSEASRFTSGRVRLDRAPTDLVPLIEGAVASMRGRLDERGVSVRQELPDAAWADVDPVRMVQVVINLVANAIKYGRPGGRIDLAVGLNGDRLKLCVNDDGPGIEESLLPVLFEPFTQAERDHERAEGGLGLGLAIVQQIVALHGGSVHAENRSSGGARFVVELRRLDASNRVAEAQT